MANINKISVNGTVYDIEDTTARASSGVGLTDDIKTALLNCLENVAWINENGQNYYDALESALYPPANLVSISCVYTQSGTVYDTDSLDDLKTDLVVTAHWDNSSTTTVTTYVLSGTLEVGTSTITVTYGGKTTTFNVTVTEYVPIEVPVTWYHGSWQGGTGDSWVEDSGYMGRSFSSYLDASSHVLNFKLPIDTNNTYVTEGVTTYGGVYVRAYDPTDDSYLGQLSLSDGTIGSSSASMTAQTITFGQEYTLLQGYRYRMVVDNGGAFSANAKRHDYLTNMFTSMYY